MDKALKAVVLIALLLAPLSCRAQQILTPIMQQQPSGCTTAAGHNYTTAFPLTENPISECSSWLNGAVDGTAWTNIQTTTNFAKGTEASTHATLDDSTAVIKGTWNSTQESRGVVVAPTAADTDKELELRLNTSISANSITGYEIQFIPFQSTTANCTYSIQRWNGPIGNFTAVATTAVLAGSNACLHTGDRIRALNLSGKMYAYINDNLAFYTTGTDTTYTGGSPGLGTFILTGQGLSSDFGLSALTATDTPIAYSQSASNDTAVSGTTVTITMGSATTTGNLLTCMAYWASTSQTGSVSDSTNGTYTAIGSPTNGAGALSSYRAQMFYMANITGFATSVHPTLTLSGAAATTDRALACHEVQGRNASGGTLVLDQSPAVKAGTGTSMSSTATSTTTSSYEYANGFCVLGASSPVISGAWIQRESANFGSNITGDFVPTATGAYQFTASQNPSSDYLCGVATFK